jgi:hypothetical protein
MKSGEQRIIDIPIFTNSKEDIFVWIRAYDSTTNTAHIICGGKRSQASYYLLRLDDYSWNEVVELKEYMAVKCYYSFSSRRFAYFLFDHNTLYVFDFDKEIFLEPISFFSQDSEYTTMKVFVVFDNGKKVLLEIMKKDTREMYYCIYDNRTKEISIQSIISDDNHFEYFVHIDNCRFLCVRGRGLFKYDLVDFDVASGEYSLVIGDFLGEIVFLGKSNNVGEYTLLTTNRDKTLWSLGASFWSFLCFFKYPVPAE